MINHPHCNNNITNTNNVNNNNNNTSNNNTTGNNNIDNVLVDQRGRRGDAVGRVRAEGVRLLG